MTQPAILHPAAARHDEGPGEHQPLGVLADVDEPPRARQLRPEPADIDIAQAVRLSHAQERGVETAAVIEVELGGLIQDGLRIYRRAEIQPPGRHAAHRTGFGGQREVVQDVLLGRHIGHAFRYADAEIHHAAWPELHRRPAGDDLPRGQLQRRDRVADPPQLSAQRRGVWRAEGLPMVPGLRNDDAVDQNARDLHLARAQAAVLGDPLHLHDH